MSESSPSVEQAVLSFFERRREDGVYVHSDADVRAFLPLAVLRLGIEVPPGSKLAAALEEQLEQAGLAKDTPLSEAAPTITRFCESRPVVMQIYAEFMEHLRSVSARVSGARRPDDEQTRALRRLLLSNDGAKS